MASAVSQGPRLDNFRARLPALQDAVVACIMPDLNGDGRLDLVRGSRHDFGIWLQDAAGRFDAAKFPKQIPTTNPAQEIVALATGRITSARSLDVLVGYRSGIVQIYPNVAGAFGKPLRLPTIAGGFSPALEQILTGDIDPKSNSLDEIVLLLDRDRPVIFTPDGMGSFTQVMLIGQRMAQPRGLLADLDMDSDLDLVMVTGGPGPTLPGLYINTGVSLAINFTAFGIKFVAGSQLVAEDVAGTAAPELFVTPIGRNPAAVRLFQNISKVPGKPSFALVPITTPGYTVVAPQDFDVADIDGDGFLDLISVTESGAVTYGLSAGASSPMSYTGAVELLPASLRKKICAMDLEGDGDTDLLVAGAGIEDSLLLGGPASIPVAEFDTEARGIPIRSTSRYMMETVDLTGEGDLDLALWSVSGGTAPVLLKNADGQARFEDLAYTGQVPALPKANYRSMQPALVDGIGSGGCLVLGNITSGNSTGVRVWVKGMKPALADETLTRWKIRRSFDSILPADVSGRLKGSRGSAGYSDVVGVDSAGYLRIVFNRSGVYDREAVISNTRVALGSKLLVADLNLDGHQDILILQPRTKVRVLLADGSVADKYVEKTSLSYSGAAAIVQDLTGDLIPDILMPSSASSSALVFLQGRGDGRFVDQTNVYLPKTYAVAAYIIEMSLLTGDKAGQHSLVIGMANAQDQILRATNWVFAAPEELRLRGSRNTSRFLVRDFDLDGDQDLVIARHDTFPALVLGQAMDFCNVGIGQAGREALIHVAYPDLATMGAIGIGFPSTRVDLGGMGILRLARLSVMLMVPSRGNVQQMLRLALPSKMASIEIPMQLMTVRGADFRFRNLDNFRPTGR